MSNISKYKNGWFLILFILIGYGQTFGVGALESPVILNLGFMVLTFSIQLRITIASIIGVILAIIAYKVI